MSPPDPLPSHTTLTLQAPDGQVFEVYRLAPHTPPRARLLVFHGYHANRYQVLGIAAALRERGFESFIMELRGHGKRPGPCTFGVREAQDAAAVLSWARGSDPQLSPPFAVLGLSMGAAVAVQVTRRQPEIRAVVADSIYSRFSPIVANQIRRRYHLPAFPWAWITWGSLTLALRGATRWLDPVTVALRMQQPLLAIHGGQDDVVPPRQAEEVYERWAGPKERWFEPSARHVELSLRDPIAYGSRVAAFLNRVLPPAPPCPAHQ